MPLGQAETPPAREKRVTVREATFALMRELGMATVFGNPGSTELPFLDRWREDFNYVLGLQEASVVAMAGGYARAAFCNLHSAAGIGHAMGIVLTAFRNRAPLVITVGQQARVPILASPFACRMACLEDHPLFAGFLPAAPGAVAAGLAGHDCVVVIGAPAFTFHVAGECAIFHDRTPIFQLTADGEAAAAPPSRTAIIGSMRLALPAPRAKPAAPEAASPLPAEYLFAALRRAMPQGAIVVEEAPPQRPALQQHQPITCPPTEYATAPPERQCVQPKIS